MTAAEVDRPLSEAESFAFRRYEQEIDKGLHTFVVVGRALAHIRDGRLYRDGYSTFEGYCAERWQLSRPRAYQLIEAADLTDGLSTNGGHAPVNERQVRELSGLDVTTAAEVMQAAAEAGPVTAKTIAAAREAIAPKPKPAPKAKVTHRETVTDITEVDTETGEITDPYAAGQAAADVAPIPAPPRESTIADAIRDAKNRPSVAAYKVVERWRLAALSANGIGGIDAVLADIDAGDIPAPDLAIWLGFIEESIAVANEWASAIRRRNLRSVK